LGGLRRLDIEALHNLYFLPNVIIMINLRRLKWEQHVARIGEKRNAYREFVGKARLKETSRGPL
jgi:hypothetical protein